MPEGQTMRGGYRGNRLEDDQPPHNAANVSIWCLKELTFIQSVCAAVIEGSADPSPLAGERRVRSQQKKPSTKVASL